MIGGFLGGLANLGGVSRGLTESFDEGTLSALRLLQLRQAQQEQQQQQQLQQAMPWIWRTMLQGQQQQQQPAQPDYSPGAVQASPLGPPSDGMATGLPSPAVRGSWYGNAPGWSDRSVGSNLQASGLPQSAPGIALPTRGGLGKPFDLTLPDGRTVRTTQTDVGPAPWTHRGVDVNAALGSQLYKGPGSFPTDGGFRVSPAGDQVPPEHREQASSIVGPLLAAIPRMFAGRMSMPSLARMIESNAPPGTSDQVKFAALKMMSQMMQPQDKEMLSTLLSAARLGETEERLTEQHRHDVEMEKTAAAGAREREQHDVAIEAGEGKQPKGPHFGTVDDLMDKWHQEFVAKNKREPTTEEIADQRKTFTQETRATPGAAQQMTKRLMIGANEVARSISSITRLPPGTTLGMFGGAQATMGPGLLENTRKALANAVTPQSAQVLKALTNGVTRGLAILEAGGAAQGLVGLSTQLAADLPQANDTGLTIAAKYADIRQIVEAATEVLQADPNLPKEQKGLLQKINQDVAKAVPFTAGDVAALVGQDSDESIATFASKLGLGGGKATGPAKMITGPEDYDKLPPGAAYQWKGPDGTIKHGTKGQ
jgi:hypothetical protein